MIIYDKNFNFLGMSLDTLSTLGYENISTFLESHEDFADLFIKKSGFVSKFNNFSWINYVLNGAAKSKDVLIKLRNNNELQATLDITEVELADSEKMYVINLVNTTVNSTHSLDSTLPKKESIFKIFEDNENIQDTNAEDIKTQVSQVENSVFDLSLDNANEDIASIKEDIFEKKAVSDDVVDTIDKIDEISFLDLDDLDKKSENTTTKIDHIKTQKDSPAFTFKDAFDIQLQSDESTAISQNDENGGEVFIKNIADNFGFDKDKVEEYLDEYVVFANEEILKLDRYVDSGDTELIKMEIAKLSGLSEILNLNDIVQKLQKILSADSIIDKKSAVDGLRKCINLVNSKLKG